MLKVFTIITLLVLQVSCNSKSDKEKNDFEIKTNAKKGNISIDNTLELSLNNKKKHIIDSVVYKLNGKTVTENLNLKHHKLCKYDIEDIVYFNDDEQQIVSTSVTILNNESPKIYKFKILNEYPHDITSYTQGLEFHDGKLYESTGQYKESKLRLVDYNTGKVTKNINLADEYFGEGLTILNNKVYQLTWQKGTGFV